MPKRFTLSYIRELLVPRPHPRNRFQHAHDLAALTHWKELGQGRHRVVYALDEKWVIKIPIGADGERANISEYEQYHQGVSRIHPHLAWCMIDEFAGVVVSIMERVDPVSMTWEECTASFAWVDRVDCRQVGYTRRGKLVAYDYSYN